MTEMLTRAAAGAVIDTDLREIEILAVPYRQPTRVTDWDGSTYLEEFDVGAFDAAIADPRSVKLLRDHSIDRIVGSAIKVWEAVTGLWIRGRLAASPLAEEAAALIEAAALEASIGFLVPRRIDPGGHVRYDRTNPVELMEVSLVPFPAYKGTSVALIRAGRLDELVTTTPLLEALYGKPRTVHTTRSADPAEQHHVQLLNEGEEWMRRDRERSARTAAGTAERHRTLVDTRANLLMQLETEQYLAGRPRQPVVKLQPALVPFGADGMACDRKGWESDDTEWTG